VIFFGKRGDPFAGSQYGVRLSDLDKFPEERDKIERLYELARDPEQTAVVRPDREPVTLLVSSAGDYKEDPGLAERVPKSLWRSWGAGSPRSLCSRDDCLDLLREVPTTTLMEVDLRTEEKAMQQKPEVLETATELFHQLVLAAANDPARKARYEGMIQILHPKAFALYKLGQITSGLYDLLEDETDTRLSSGKVPCRKLDVVEWYVTAVREHGFRFWEEEA
jgi:hypothetical protein